MITQIDQFKEIIEGNYKILDLKSYMDYKIDVSKRGLTQQEIDLLSPDNINSCSFWEYIEKNPELAKDAIAFGVTKEQTKQTVNEKNFGLACSLNALSYVLLYRNCQGMPLLDIGAGYGMLKEYVEKETKLVYAGVDVYPKVSGVYQVGEDGSTLPPNIAASKFGLVVSCNVFQHLSIKQRRHYYEQIEKLLYPDFGIFTVTTIADIPISRVKGFRCKDNGRYYACHYGQYTEVQTVEELEADLSKHFFIISVSQRTFDCSFTFHCSLKKPELQVVKLADMEKT
jgi:SAM-dependent methyltransferase